MKIVGLTRVRNESEIMQETLDHMSEFCEQVFVYDDCSEDNTVEICKNHPIVTSVVQGQSWDSFRARAEFENRHAVYMEASKHLSENDWFVYMDADERIEFNWEKLNNNLDAVRMNLFDFYITEEDVDKKYTERKWIGPEYRSILFAFRYGATTGYHGLDQRECSLKSFRILDEGSVKHYGKAISVDQWEETCDYYANHFPMYAAKWLARKGKAVHTESDFDRDLILWKERFKKGLPL
jgi:glycosyltransferase involved in cell wall biosynthesis